MPKEVDPKNTSLNYIEPEMFEATFNFWFNDDKHIRSPFPVYIREELTDISTKKFSEWASNISADAKKDINDEILAEKFEEIIFETALKLVLTEDEKLTIRYPFLLRVDDVVSIKDVEESKAESRVISRSILKKGDNVFMKVLLKNLFSNENWETEFELPE